MKEALAKSGLDTETFSAHSTRHASTSAAKRLGVDVEMIRKTEGWTKSSETFARFYNREVLPDREQFALSILNSA